MGNQNFINKNRAFSLMELSIVIVIIGIVIAGLYESMMLYRKMKLEAARSITSGSPVPGVYGLALWLDTTSTASFQTEYSNNDPVSQWNDINPQTSNKNLATQTTASLQPLYKTGVINGLPAIKCDGIDDLLSIDSGSPYLPSSTPSITNNFSLFLVATPTITHEIDPQDNTSTKGTSGQKYIIGALHGSVQYGSSTIAGMGLSLGTNGVTVYEHSGGYMPPIAVYSGSATSSTSVITIEYNNKTPTIFVNGTSVATGLTSNETSVFPSNQFCSGSYGAFSGYIGEIIVYNNRIPSNKRQQIEKYLGKKWGIKIN